MLRGFWNDMKEWFLETAKVLRREFGLVLSSPGTLLFFLRVTTGISDNLCHHL